MATLSLRRLCLLLLGIVALLALPGRKAWGHAGLVSSTPARDARVATAPRELRLLFTEELEIGLSSLELVDAHGTVTRLVPRADPHDVRSVLGDLPALPAGTYRIAWRVVSADGHPVHGSYAFTVTVGVTPAPAAAAPAAASSGSRAEADVAAMAQLPEHERPARAPLGAALLRGLAALALLAAAGVLALVPWAPAPAAAPRGRRLGAWLAAAALVLLLGDALAWAAYAADGLSADALLALLATTPGRVVAARLLLTLLAVWAALLARRTGLAAFLALLAVAAGGFLGHAAAVHPWLAAPLKLVHLAAVAGWIGGVVLLLGSVLDREAAAAAAGRVSALALAASLAVGLTGVLLAVVFLDRPAQLLSTDYGRLVLLKAAGMLLLVGFGALYRLRMIPRLRLGEGRRMRAALRAELVVFTLVVLVAGFLAYTPLPGEAAASAASSSAGGQP